MFAIDTNLLVYAHNTSAKFHNEAAEFVTRSMNERDGNGKLSVCLPAQTLTEFIYVMTWQRMDNPMPLPEATRVARDYVDTGVMIVNQRETQIGTFLDLLSRVASRKKVFDVALAATLRDNGIPGIYTVNVPDFVEFDFLQVVNTLEPEAPDAKMPEAAP